MPPKTKPVIAANLQLAFDLHHFPLILFLMMSYSLSIEIYESK